MRQTQREATRLRPRIAAIAVPWLLLVCALAAQITWPLLPAGERTWLTMMIVGLIAATSISHAWVWQGPRWTLAFIVLTAGISLLAEIIGVATGLPFGTYSYDRSLGWEVGGVPVIIACAWLMMAYPALTVARQLAGKRWAVIATGTWALASWDVFLDPQMIAEGHWTWAPGQALVPLPGLTEVPLQNFAGWLVVSLVLMVVLTGLRSRPAPTAVPDVLYLWTWLGGITANLLFLDRPWVALWGGLAMGVIGLPLLVTSAVRARAAASPQ